MQYKFCFTTLCSAALLAGLTFTGVQNSAAAVRKDVSEHAGKNCTTPPKGSGVVVGLFTGTAERKFFPYDSNTSLNRYKCFTSMSECQGWLYTMNTLYSVNGPTPVSRCFIR
ncbi:hypothetical protein FHS77_000866 [Paenochrobactrum gallinarii]|uniref:Metallophosphoesterase n=1 Tax=Paenochrobactrum gallinarii TaxID=643673 RepID=A0A841LUW0_9HYPH|nr:metallophosphoesterase [Paenochrobactrum gallinarii]MBB6260342.1 hypothetical protein [Paenochrobactrum gallinarii]